MTTTISKCRVMILGLMVIFLSGITRGQKNVDNRKPVFTQCKTYAPSVLEEQPTGTFVQKVTAYDPDMNDVIEYSLVNAPGEKPKFRINPITGEIVTERVFDRDEPSREKEVYITVRVTDNGRPVLDDVCTFKVTIADVNDNPPVFDKAKYDELMSEDTKPGTVFMRITASDLDDGKNSIVIYKIKNREDYSYFEIDRESGRIKLIKAIDRPKKSFYHIVVEASNPDQSNPQSQTINVNIQIIESNKKPPHFTEISPDAEIFLPENFSDFTAPIVTFTAISNVENQPEVVFELITGRTEQTNMRKTFISNQTGNTATILLGSRLDYEVNPEYMLTMSVKNIYDLVEERSVRILLEDVNDNIPFFTDVTSGSISENEPPGTPVMQVRGFDNDGTSKNNIVSFRLDEENREFFQIDSETGNITSLRSFDREARDYYNVKIIATDNSPSALYNTGEPNKGQQVFRIQIADKNDHSPKFTQSEYIADKLPEDANVNSLVIEVQALDVDTASQIVYEIISGNTDDAFAIEEKTGRLKINKPLDYETLTEYKLQIRASDGLFNDSATVIIKLEDVNDNPPIMMPSNATVQIEEETIPDGCIVSIDAYDPDIKESNVDQRIVYEIVDDQKKKLFTVDKGCLRLISPLDRDKPFGFKSWQIFVAAIDDNGNGLKTSGEYTIELNDINDNAPFLTTTSIVWMENQGGGPITQLLAQDYDEPQNGPPFTFEIDSDADEDIKMKFDVTGNQLSALKSFDREEQKIYKIPIRISDSGFPQQSNISYFTIIIGDVNDNPMQEGESNIFIYNYKGEAPDTQIGRVYVNDPDDWDLPDKTFNWYEGLKHESFSVNHNTGMITMKRGTQGGNHTLKFEVIEESNNFPRHTVVAIVNVEVKVIPEEAVHNSGSVRFYGITAEDFVAVPPIDEDTGYVRLSYKDRFRNIIAKKFNISEFNVDVFTVLHKSDNSSFLDVRFTAHNSPYYDEIILNSMVSQNQAEIERELGIQMYMINIDECIIERAKCESSCYNRFYATPDPIQVYTNTTSFVGVNAFVQAECVCYAPPTMVCYNGGTQVDETCECIEGFEGPHCELTSIGFYGDGYAHYKPTNPCDSTNISIVVEPRSPNGLILYMGPMAYNSLLHVQDFLAFEMINAYPVVTVDYGTGSTRIFYNYTKFEMNQRYQVDIILQKSSIEMVVNNCRLSKCLAFAEPVGDNEYLNVNQPLQLGGSSVDLEAISALYRWSHTPQKQGFNGCVKRLAIGDKVYNLGDITVAKNADSGCHRSLAATVSFGIDTNFLIAILVCLALLIILLLAVVVTKKRQDGWHEKDMDDIRETIINYEDEGGGERDTDYDLDVLRGPPIYEDQPRYGMRKLQHEPNNEVPDIGGFLVDKKDTCDRDNDAHPFDDMRHYAYEGDGNSTGSLSSLASCTDDGDLKFDYLSNFGPRFRKLADMYGEEPSDTDSNVDGDEGWRI